MRTFVCLTLIMFSMHLFGQTKKQLEGEWRLSAPYISDTLKFRKYDPTALLEKKPAFNPDIILYVYPNHEAMYYHTFSNAKTTNGIVDKEQPQGSSTIEIVDGDTLAKMVLPPALLSGAKLDPRIWKLSSNGKVLTLLNKEKCIAQNYKVIVLTTEYLTLVKW